MKKQILIIASFLFSITLNAQVETNQETQKKVSNEELGKMYRQKGKEQKIVGFVFLGVGLAFAVNAYHLTNEDLSKVSTSAIISGACLLVSIPLFVSSGKNKRKAEILFQQNSLSTNLNIKGNKSIMSMGIGIPIGK